MNLRVSDIRQCRKNSLRGFFSLHLPSGFTIHDCTWHESNGRRWIGFPARPYNKPDGTQSWATLIELPRERMDRLRDAVLPMIDAQTLTAADQA